MEEDWSGYEVVNPAAGTETSKPVSLSGLLYETTIMLLECIICILMYPSIMCVCMLLDKKSAPELLCVCYNSFSYVFI